MTKLLLYLPLFSGLILAMDAPETDLQKALALSREMISSQENQVFQRALDQSTFEATLKESRKLKEQLDRDANLARSLQESNEQVLGMTHKINEKFLAVFPQRGLTCGLRSIHNVSLIWEYIQGRITESNMTERLTKQTTEGLIPTDNKNHQVFFKVGVESYDEQVIQKLRRNHTNIPNDKFFVIAHAGIYLNTMHFYPHYAELAQALMQFKDSANDTLCFVVGNIPLNASGTSGGFGHWIGVVAHKQNNQIKLYIADSIISQDEYAKIARITMMSVIHALIK